MIGTRARSTMRAAARVACTIVVAAAGLSLARPALSGERVGTVIESSASSLQAARSGDLRASNAGSTWVGADLGFARTAVAAAPSRAEELVSDRDGARDGAVQRGDFRRAANAADGIASSALVEPVGIAVLGFTAAALIAIRRRKNAKLDDGAAVQRIS